MMKDIFSWQQSQWQILQKRISEHTLPHALLFTGTAGLGKRQFAEVFAQAVLCVSPVEDNKACGACKACQLILAQTHPDLIIIQPDEAGKAIKLDQIRYLLEIVAQTPQQGKYKIIILAPADAMNKASANALLKTLEEPAANTLLILITEQLAQIPATLRSRCQILQFQSPSYELAVDWLKVKNIAAELIPLLLNLAEGAPLKVLSLIEDKEVEVRQKLFQQWQESMQASSEITKIAQEWQAITASRIIAIMIRWLMDMIRWRLTQDESCLINIDLKASLVKLAKSCPIESLYEYLDYLEKMGNLFNRQANLNTLLTLESILIQGKKIFS